MEESESPLLDVDSSPRRRRLASYKARKNSGKFWHARRRKFLLPLLLLSVASAFLFLAAASSSFSQCEGASCSPSQTRPPPVPPTTSVRPRLPTSLPVNLVTFSALSEGSAAGFRLNGTDVMVYLHVQKTGGTTFGKHLVQDVKLARPCVCRKRKGGNKKRRKHLKQQRLLDDEEPPADRKEAVPLSRTKRKISCDCFRPGVDGASHWLFSRYSTGWKCGLHPDWTELTACVDHYFDSTEGHVDDRRYFYITFLRDPVSRYLSEFKHVQRGATWRDSRHLCHGRPPTEEEMPSCYPEGRDDWVGVTIDEFVACKSNLANNRQTRMLADLRLVNCYNTSGIAAADRDRTLLDSAKQNLGDTAFFGLTEHQLESQYLFEEVFGMEFAVKFFQYDHDHASKAQEGISGEVLERIKALNALDIELYDHAKLLMERRVAQLRATDPDFQAKMDGISGRDEEEPDDEDDTEDEY